MNIKTELKIGILSIIVIFLILAGFIYQYKKQIQNLNQITNFSSPNTTTPSESLNKNINTQTTSQQISLSWDEVKKHNNPKDCWLVIAGNVYDVTSYPNLHPGGADLILKYCGKDATTAFQTKGGKGSHSDKALQILSQFYIGKLGEKVNYSQKAPNPNVKLKRSEKDSESKDKELEFDGN